MTSLNPEELIDARVIHREQNIKTPSSQWVRTRLSEPYIAGIDYIIAWAAYPMHR